LSNHLTDPDHPIATTLQRISALDLYVDVRLGIDDSPGWVHAVSLDDIPARTAALVPTDDREVLASYALNGYSWPLVMAALACLVLERRVPDIRVEYVSVRFSPDGYPDAIALHSPRFTALPGDPDSGHPDAVCIPEVDGLREACRTGLETHMGLVITSVRRALPWGKRAMWLTVADRCASALMLLHRKGLLPAEQLLDEIDALVHQTGSPLRSPRTKAVRVEQENGSCLTLERGSCCLAYRLPDSAYCDNCPLRKREAIIPSGEIIDRT
jgi:ferric iron reductase protein FhuF